MLKFRELKSREFELTVQQSMGFKFHCPTDTCYIGSMLSGFQLKHFMND
jgi:hypothetical protein